MRIARLTIPLLLVALLAACAPPEAGEGEAPAAADTTAADEAALRQIAEDWEAAYNAGDAAALAQIYAEDAVRFGGGQPLIEGRAAIEQQFAEALEAGETQAGIDVDEVQITGDRAYTRGRWHLTGTVEGEPAESHGKWLAIFARQADGSWKEQIDASNANTPPPGAAAEEGDA